MADVEKVFRRDRAIIIISLLVVVLLAWGFIYSHATGGGAAGHAGHDAHLLSAGSQEWRSTDLIVVFTMWSVMMIGMMIPSASPMILTYAMTSQRQRESGGQYTPTAFFVLGYVVVWTLYSGAAAGGQWALHTLTLLSPRTQAASPFLSGGLLVLAGLFQWTPLKYNCLSHCRSPLGFIINEWRDGLRGAFLMGAKHGSYCVGCCWALMLLMFVVGVMDLLWMAALTGYLLLEKVAPGGERISRVAGALFVGAGLWILTAALVG